MGDSQCFSISFSGLAAGQIIQIIPLMLRYFLFPFNQSIIARAASQRLAFL
jgi:hypothetical protein